MAGPAEIIHGPMLIGTMINIFLYGIMITQVYIYYTTYKRDNMFIKIFVFALLLADAINTVFEIVYVYMCLIPHFGDVQYLAVTTWVAEITPASTGAITLMVQLFYAWRIHVLTRNWLAVGVVVSLSLASAISSWVTTWLTITKLNEYIRLQEAKGVITSWLACAAAADIVITIVLVRHLVRCTLFSDEMWQLNYIQRKHKSGFQQTDMTINRIIRVTMQTCLTTTVVAIVDLAVYLGSPSGTHLLFMFFLCKLYSNSLISSLNSRGGWKYDTSRAQESGSKDTHGESSPTRGRRVDITTSQPSTGKPKISLDTMTSGKSPRKGVFVHVESHEMEDVVLCGKHSEA